MNGYLARTYKSAGKWPVIDQGAKDIAGWTDDDGAVAQVDLPVVIFGDHTRALKYVDFRFAVGADGTKVLRPRSSFDAQYLYYALCAAPVRNLGYSRHFRLLRELIVPRPPLEEQRRIGTLLASIDASLRKAESQHLDTLSAKAAVAHRLMHESP